MVPENATSVLCCETESITLMAISLPDQDLTSTFIAHELSSFSGCEMLAGLMEI